MEMFETHRENTNLASELTAKKRMNGRSWNILMIEDDDDFSEVVRAGLRKLSSVSVTCAQDTYEALDLMVERPYDLVIVDWKLHDMTGVSVLRMFDEYLEFDDIARHRWGALGKIPVIMMTGHQVRPEDLGHYRSFTVIDVISKKQDLESILDDVEQNIRALNVVSEVLRKGPQPRRVS